MFLGQQRWSYPSKNGMLQQGLERPDKDDAEIGADHDFRIA